jgi:anti-sigma28 factor (negative regulator of flagellin synthesis)
MKVGTIESALRSANARKIERIRKVSQQKMSASTSAWQKRSEVLCALLQTKQELLAIQQPSTCRNDLIEQLRNEIVAGTYQADSQVIVNRMLEDQRSVFSLKW